MLDFGGLAQITLYAPASTTVGACVGAKEPRAFWELGSVFSFFPFLLLEPWIKQLTLEAGGCGVLCAEKQARPGPGPGLTAKEKSI